MVLGDVTHSKGFCPLRHKLKESVVGTTRFCWAHKSSEPAASHPPLTGLPHPPPLWLGAASLDSPWEQQSVSAARAPLQKKCSTAARAAQVPTQWLATTLPTSAARPPRFADVPGSIHHHRAAVHTNPTLGQLPVSLPLSGPPLEGRAPGPCSPSWCTYGSRRCVPRRSHRWTSPAARQHHHHHRRHHRRHHHTPTTATHADTHERPPSLSQSPAARAAGRAERRGAPDRHATLQANLRCRPCGSTSQKWAQ
jgi:hypothetical protein